MEAKDRQSHRCWDKPGGFDSSLALRDVAWLGDSDQGCLALADLLGWKVRSYHPSSPRAQSLDPPPTGPPTQ